MGEIGGLSGCGSGVFYETTQWGPRGAPESEDTCTPNPGMSWGGLIRADYWTYRRVFIHKSAVGGVWYVLLLCAVLAVSYPCRRTCGTQQLEELTDPSKSPPPCAGRSKCRRIPGISSPRASSVSSIHPHASPASSQSV
jgi:hypothetical protein